MERLALTCHVLYNQDILDKKKEIEKLKESIIIEPKIFFKSKNEWNNFKKIFFNTLEESIFQIIVEDDYYYGYIENIKYYINDICSGQRYNIYTLLFTELNNLTSNKYQKWCENICDEIIFTIDSGIQTLKNMDMLDNFSENDLAEFIIKNIIWQINDGKKLEHIIVYE
jgi:hypothetical protein